MCLHSRAAIDDELMLQCKHWRVPMRVAPPKEKADAAALRQSQVRDDLKKAETEYYRAQAETMAAVRDWFYHTAEKRS